MTFDRYMSEILKYNRVVLGNTEVRFLNEMMGKPKSVYSIWSERGRDMAYKNVHTRIKRLEELNLIKKIPEKGKYGKINYQLTTQGLLYQVSRFVKIDESLSWSSFLDRYSNDIIFETFVLPYFEKDTIKHAGVRLYFAMISYLHNCYQITLDAADRIRKAIEEQNKEDEEYYTERLKVDLEWQPRIFAFRLIMKPRNKAIFSQLAKDKKFVMLLAEVQKDFEKGWSVVKNVCPRL